MKLAMLLAIAAPALAHAHTTTFDEYSGGQPANPASQVYEAACDLDVEMRGGAAVVELRQRFVNPGPTALAVRYVHELPTGAVVTSFAIKPQGGGIEPAVAVPGGFRVEPVESADVLGADPAILTKLADGRYEVIVQPLAPEHDVTLITHYTAFATPRAGALHLVMPGRVATGKLAACKGALRALPGPGATVRALRPGRTFVVDTAPVALDVDLDVAGTAPIAWTQTQPLGDAWNASLVTVLAPRVVGKPAGMRRFVFVVDTSKSMEMVGRPNVAKVIKALGSALPAGAEVEAILFDRSAKRVFGAMRPATPANLGLIDQALGQRGAQNGSDIVGAFALAKQTIEADPTRGQTMLIVITDGVTPELGDQALIQTLSSKTSAIDVHAIVLDPGPTRSPGAKLLRGPVNLYGGAYVEVGVDDLDDAMIAIDEWMRPSWLELAISGVKDVPTEVRGGAGFTKLVVHKGAANFTLTGHSEAVFKSAGRATAAAPIAPIALIDASPESLAGPDPDGPTLEAAGKALAKAIAAYPSAERDHALVVLASTGRIAKNRRDMIKGGGRYERTIAVADPKHEDAQATMPAPIPAAAIARLTLERIFRDQLQPRAYACYQRALGVDGKLAGTAHFAFRLGRGEVTDVQVTGFTDKTFVACLVDAGYAMTVPMPDFKVNSDDQTVASYPLTFQRRDDRPVIVLGDADSSSPIDIDAVEGGVPIRTKKVKVDSKTPLGGMKPPKSP